ncbi:tyrosine-type recombinase/integrase [Mesorhizobium yinganensis]|uniref:tyrosine-type recombinase/integrase n=1 Tax=Mesorhizobium yinganensis TaxID=3157707 RepID=UPI0032B844C7
MPTVELTDKFCAAVKSADGSQKDYFDTIVRGLSLRVSPAGTKAFNLNYTKPIDGKRARMKLGRYPEMKLAKAREKARLARGNLGEGQDPIAGKRALLASQTVAELVENYIDRHASTKRSGKAIARRLRRNVKELIGSIKLADLHRRDLTRCIDAAKDRGAHVEANRIFEDMRSMIKWARARGDLDQNLTEGMRKPTETVERDRVLTANEIRTMWPELDTAGFWRSTGRAIKLCLVTGQRVGEVSGMTLDEISLDKAVWTIPANRAKNGREHVVPLSAMALGIIREQLAAADALTDRKRRTRSPYVFPGVRTLGSLTPAAVAQAIGKRKVGAAGSETVLGIARWTCHDLRRSAATHMEELGVSPFVIGHVLNHATVTKGSITSRVYARYTYDKEKRAALDLWAARLMAIIEGKDNVMRLRAARA